MEFDYTRPSLMFYSLFFKFYYFRFLFLRFVKCLELYLQLYASDDLDNEVDEILQDFEHKINRPILHTALFY